MEAAMGDRVPRRTRQTARKSTGGRPPAIQLVTSGGHGCQCRCRSGWGSSGSRKRPRSSREDGFSDGSDADDVARGVAEEQPAAEEEDSDDDDRPIRIVSSACTLVHGGSTSTAPAPASAPAPPVSSPPAAAPAPPESSPTAPAPAPPSSSLSDSSSVIRNVTLENSSTFDCSICYLPLRSPIFQCTVGHVLCSPCHDKLGLATNCHVCRVPIPDGYFRCNVMEQVVDSIRVPCPHAAHGCAEQVVYHDRDAHARTCVFKPCHCPGEGCSFAGPVQTTLLEHFAAVHGWPCIIDGRTTGNRNGFDVRLRKGFNIVVVTADATTLTPEQQYTLVLNVQQVAPVCSGINAFCIHPSNTGTVRLLLSSRGWFPNSDCNLQISPVVFTDLSNGMPGPSSRVSFFVPRCSAAPGDEDDDVKVRVMVTNIGGTVAVTNSESCTHY